MKQISYSFLLKAEQPIAHHEGSFGNVSVVMRHKIRQPDGSFVQVPYLTGDTLRHQMREGAAYAYLAAAGIEEGLTEAALRLLFNGGMISGESGSSISLSQWRELSDLFPVLALMGGCASNRTIPGRLQVDAAELVCDETLHLLPVEVRAYLDQTTKTAGFRAHLEEHQRVRMDSLLDPGKRTHLLPAARKSAEDRLLGSEKASKDGDAKETENNKSSMMPRSFEALCAGSLFYWRVTATCYTDLDEDTFHVAVAAFLSDAHVGGKKSVGCGKVRVLQGFQGQTVTLVQRLESFALDTGKIGTVFRAHVESKKEAIKKFLAEVQA